jgi:hypothetical protein
MTILPVVAAIAAVAGLGYLLFGSDDDVSSGAPPGPSGAGEPPPDDAEEDEPIAPAYPGLVAAPRAVRVALRDVARAVNLSPASLATVIEGESEWDPSLPKSETGLPRGGLIQLTVGANLPGFTNAAAVWAIRAMDAATQLYKVVLPNYKRFKLTPAMTALDLYKRNFLPSDVNKPHDFHLGDANSPDPWRRAVFKANPGFAHGKSYFTWEDVATHIRGVEKRAKGKWVTTSAKIVDAPLSASPVTVPPAAPAAPAEPSLPSKPPPAVAPAVSSLLARVDELWPKRLKASDGTLGDLAHQQRKSDHNLGLALDVTLDPDNGPDLDALAGALLADPRVTYVIWRKRIANRDIQGGAWRDYTGENPHTRHLHVSIREGARNDLTPWILSGVGTGTKDPPAPAVVVPPAGAGGSIVERIKLGLVPAWDAGLVDNARWSIILVEGSALEVTSDCLSVGGIRMPVSFADVLYV